MSAVPPSLVPSTAAGVTPGRSQLRAPMLRRALVVAVPTIFVLRLTYFLFQDMADGDVGRVGERLFDETTGALLAAIPLALLFWVARRFPLARPFRRWTGTAYAACFAAGTVLHTTAMISVRAVLAPLLGFHGYPLAFAASRYGYEAATEALIFIAMLALLALAENVLGQRERERRAAALERSLLRAELSNLRLQLQPHFLFNALNTISSTMYDDVQAADALLGRLADLLRTSLRTTHAHEVPVREELAVLEQYLGLMRARFGGRLEDFVSAPEEVLDLAVPSMVLQPLVENAVRHGGVSRVGRGRITVTLVREGNQLLIRVHDDGPPPDASDVVSPDSGTGTGLSTTERRLQLLYGEAQSMRAGRVADGFEVVLRIPATQVSRLRSGATLELYDDARLSHAIDPTPRSAAL